MGRKVIITCAVTGSADTVEKNAAVPVTPREIAESTIEAAKAGAAVAHIHVRDPETGKASMDLELYRETVQRIRDSDTDIVLNLTTGPGARFRPGDKDPTTPGPGTFLVAPWKRIEHIIDLKPEICSLDIATMNTGGVRNSAVMMNAPNHLEIMAGGIAKAKVKPELEVFDSGHVRHAAHLVDQGIIESPPLFQLCLGIEWGASASPASLQHLVSLLPTGSNWAAFSISREHFRTVALCTLLGGHVRVGLEDCLYLEQGKLAPSNAALVEKAARIVRDLGDDLATPEEARKILSVG